MKRNVPVKTSYIFSHPDEPALELAYCASLPEIPFQILHTTFIDHSPSFKANMRGFPFLAPGFFALLPFAIALPIVFPLPKKIYGVNLGSWYALTLRPIWRRQPLNLWQVVNRTLDAPRWFVIGITDF